MFCLLTASTNFPPIPFSLQISNKIKEFVEFKQKGKMSGLF
jgi:hypothetical protein